MGPGNDNFTIDPRLEQPDHGRIRLGHEVHPSYFSQLTADEDLSGTPFSQIMETADLDNTEARTILGRFLFSGDDGALNQWLISAAENVVGWD